MYREKSAGGSMWPSIMYKKKKKKETNKRNEDGTLAAQAGLKDFVDRDTGATKVLFQS